MEDLNPLRHNVVSIRIKFPASNVPKSKSSTYGSIRVQHFPNDPTLGTPLAEDTYLGCSTSIIVTGDSNNVPGFRSPDRPRIGRKSENNNK